jgi:hypothetical protein
MSIAGAKHVFRSYLFLFLSSLMLMGCAAAGGYPDNPVAADAEIKPLAKYLIPTRY